MLFYDFGNFDQLKMQIDHYIKNDNDRKQIAVQGQNTVVNSCTYHDRLREAFGVMGFEL